MISDSVTVSDGTNTTNAVYAYNGDGLRVQKTVDGTLTHYLYEYDKIILEEDALGSQTAWNIYGINLIARKVGVDTLLYMYNGHADVTALLDTSGNVIATYYYDAFGNILTSTGSADNSILYAGYQYDEETGLYYLNARMYDPITARFMQEDTYRGDPNDPLTLNLYTYCANNPLIYSDPSGHMFVEGTEIGGHVKASEADYDEKATKVILENRQAIVKAADEFNVDAQTIAASIYTEQSLNVNWIDTLTDWLGATGLIDMSIGVAQIRVSTARTLESTGYIERSTSTTFLTDTVKDPYAYSVSMKLMDNETNIRYAGAYLKYIEDDWKDEYPVIAEDPYILSTIYNQGNRRPPHDSPEPNPFGAYAGDNYDYMNYLLNWDHYFGD